MSFNSSGSPQPAGLTEKSSIYAAKHSSPHDDIRWVTAERRIAKLLSLIEPNSLSERRRKAVSDYVKDLIQKCLDCQVFKFGSVPLKTYLPDGDIDLTTFSRHPNLKDTWANDVQAILKYEEQRKDTQFCVREVQCIPAEVKIVKCLVEGIVVDISFNQLGGLSTLCFLEEVDRLIQKDHLFKRSIILVKAWCYYESRLLGAHHGLISTYALETLVLYIFNVFHATLRSPLEVLFTFMDYFGNFDWEKYCVSIWGPIPLASTPISRAEPPLITEGDFLLTKGFLEACQAKYAKGQDIQSRVFGEKFLNVLDPLQTNNNLGRSVSKASYFRIRSAFSLGARKLRQVFQSSGEKFTMYLDDFFSNTWERHQSGVRRDTLDSASPPLQILSCKDEGIDRDASVSNTSLATQKGSGVRQSLDDADHNDAWEVSAEDTMSPKFAQTPLNPSISCSANYRENPSTNMDMHVKVQQDAVTPHSNSLTNSLTIVKSQKQIPQFSLRRTVSEGRLDKLSDLYSVGNVRAKTDTSEGLGILGANSAATNTYNGTGVTKPVVMEEIAHLQGWGTDTFQEGNSINARSKSVNECILGQQSRTLADQTSHNTPHEERNFTLKVPVMQPTVHTHDQSHIPYAYFPGYTFQPGTFMFSPFSPFVPPLQSGDLNIEKMNGLAHGSPAVTLPIPFASPPVHIQLPRGPVPPLIPYSSGVQNVASIPPFHSQDINGIEQPEKQELPQSWSYANGSPTSSQVLDFNIGNADAGSAVKHRKVPQVDIQDRKFSTVPKSKMDNFSRYPSSCPSNPGYILLPQTSSDLATAHQPTVHPEGFQSSSVEVASPTRGIVMESGLGSQGVLDTAMCFPVGTFPGFPYYNPSYCAQPDFGRGFQVDAMKGMKQYSGHDYAHLCDIGPEGSRSIGKAYNDIEEMPNGSDSDSTARAVSAAGSFLESATDFLCSDLAHHLQDLEFGRSCQEPVIDPYVSNNPLSWKVLPYISIHKIPGFPQYPVPSNPVLTFSHMHVPNVSPQSYACSISDSQQQQIGTQPSFPLRRSLYNNNIQCFAESCRQETAQRCDHRNGACGGSSRHRNGMSSSFDSTGNGNDSGNTQIFGAPHRAAGGKHMDRNNSWRKSHRLTSNCLPTSSALVDDRSKEFPGFRTAHTHVQNPEPSTQQLSSHDMGGVPPLVAQLEFGSLGPLNGLIPSKQTDQLLRLSSANPVSAGVDEGPFANPLSRANGDSSPLEESFASLQLTALCSSGDRDTVPSQ